MRCVRGVCNYINRFSFLISWLYKLYILYWTLIFRFHDNRCIGSRYNKLHEHLWVSINGTVICWDWWSLGETRWFAGLGQLQMFVTTKLQNGVFFWFTNQAFKSSILFTAQHRHREQAIPKISDIEKFKKVRGMKASFS